MSTTASPHALPTWSAPAPTKEEVTWADILTVDLSLYDTRREELVQTVAIALQRDGFFYVVGHDISSETAGYPIPGITLRLIQIL